MLRHHLITTAFTLCLWGCASLSPVVDNDDTRQHHSAESGILPGGQGWWYARFYIDWPENEDIRWYIGTLIGGEVIAPTYEKYHQEVSLWRVHRRAGRDKSGHVFSFVFYSTPQTAQGIYSAIEDHVVVKSLLESGRLTRFSAENVSSITRPNIEDTSDDSWPLSVRKAWPAMIMGSSRMWLELVSELSAREKSTDDLEAKYKKVQEDITRLWQEEGQHAVLHHLNALYAYQPLLIRY